MHPQFLTLTEAVLTLPAEGTIALGGFDIVRAPMALVFELVRQGGRSFELVSTPNPLAADILIGTRLVEKATLAFSGFQYEGGFAVGPMWKAAVESGELDYREVDAYSILCGLRAAAMGLPFLPLTDIDGSELADPERRRKLSNPFNGNEITATRPIEPDVALIHAQAADRNGNLYIEDPIVDELVAKASKRVLATTEELVERVERPTIPFYQVDAVIESQRGAWPTACPGHYKADHDHIRLYLHMATEDRFEEYRQRFIERAS
jgi:glutaconate CoA-transferase subunit A